ncbi:DUF5606 domain-containing protein [Pollutibacter soli]|uniref:DUF5606 family protein n=1 Tax=Pollutibacter soli TaxID=3034157 RepID=UPI00301414C5
MEYNKIISVTGLPGLYELISSKNDGAIVRSLDDKSTKFVSSRIHNFSHLESIEVYTTGDNVNLAEVFEAMKNSGDKLPDEKDANAVKKYFEKIFPTIDFSRVYNNDMKKMIRWYSLLDASGVEIKVPVEQEEVEEEEVVVVEEVAEEPKAAAKPKASKKAAPADKEEKEKEEAPAKKSASKKAEPKEEAAPKKTKAATAKKKKED